MFLFELVVMLNMVIKRGLDLLVCQVNQTGIKIDKIIFLLYVVQVSLWCTESFNQKSTLEEHTEWITDVRFCPSMLRVATSSADKTVRVWDVDNVRRFYLQPIKIKFMFVVSFLFHSP